MSWKDITHELFAEKMLWLSVLRRAIFDFVLYKGVGKYKRRWQLARQYIFHEDIEYEDTLSFKEVCDLFGWEPDHIRRMAATLQRCDIKKLEAMRFKGDFDPGTMYQPIREIWELSDAPVPFLAPNNYSKKYRPMVRLRRIPVAPISPPALAPLVRWEAARAA
jgi:hypothetical protein